MTYEFVDSDILHGNLNSPLPAGNVETFIIRARPEHYHSAWWYGVEVTHSGGRKSQTSNLVQVVIDVQDVLDRSPVVYTTPTTTPTTTSTTSTTTTTTTTTTPTTRAATTDQSDTKEDADNPVVLYASIVCNVVLMITLSFIIGRILWHRRETANPKDNVDVDNIHLRNVAEPIVVDSNDFLENVSHDNVDESIVVDLNDLSDNVPPDNVDEAAVVELHDLSDNVIPGDNVDEAIVVNLRDNE